MIMRGEKDAIIQEFGYSSIRKLFKSSKKTSTLWAMLPLMIGYVCSHIIDFATSGISTDIVHVASDDVVSVIGLVGEGIDWFKPSFPSISRLASTAHTEPSVSLLSPEIGLLGLKSNLSGVQVSPFVVGDEVSVYGVGYEIPFYVSVSFCLEVFEIDNDNGDRAAFQADACRENIVVESKTRDFSAVYYEYTEVVIDYCVDHEDTIRVGNQGLSIAYRAMTFDGKDVVATCGSIFETIIESCVWMDDGILYFGDWNPSFMGSCTENGSYDNLPYMSIVGIEYDYYIETFSDAAIILVAMTSEIFGGTGRLNSRQQLVEILGSIVKLESMSWGVQDAYLPRDVVEVTVATWVLVIFLVSFVLSGMAWLACMKFGNTNKFFVPVSSSDWSACAARDKFCDSKSWYALPPEQKYYDNYVYTFGPVQASDKDVRTQELSWFPKSEVTRFESVTLAVDGGKVNVTETSQSSSSGEGVDDV